MAKRRTSVPEPKAPTMKKITYKGFTVVQSSRNHHVMIGKDGKMVFHVSADHPMTVAELKQMVDDYIILAERLGAKR